MTLSEQMLSLREQDSTDEGEHMATVNFHLRYKTNFGQGVKLIGSDPKLGTRSSARGGRVEGRCSSLGPPSCQVGMIHSAALAPTNSCEGRSL